jgi:hypothetical protein
VTADRSDNAMTARWHLTLLEDFRQQHTALQSQYTRMHGRLQLVTGLNSTLLPVFATVSVAASKGDFDQRWLILFPVTGLLLSAVGYLVGANDRWLVTVYRRQLADDIDKLAAASDRPLGDPDDVWLHAGCDPRIVAQTLDRRDKAKGVDNKPDWWERLLSKRFERLSVTRLPAVMSLLFGAIWAAILVVVIIVVTA